MKRICLALISFLLMFQFSYGQWTPGTNIITTTNNVGIGFGPSTASHLLTIDSTNVASTAWYGTTNQTNNFQRIVLLQPNSTGNDNSAWEFRTQSTTGGTGIDFDTGSSDFRILGYTGSGNADLSGFDILTNYLTVNANAMRIASSVSATSGINNVFVVLGNVQQAASAGYNGLWISAYEKTLGTGIHHLLDMGTNNSINGGTYTSKFMIDDNGNGYYMGNVGIGTTIPDTKLTVNGGIDATLVNIDLSVPGPDYVFANDYLLPSLPKLSRYIALNHHLPSIPSAKEIKEKGINIAEFNMQLLQKIEELTLYNIASDKVIQDENNMVAQDQLKLKEHQAEIDLLMKQVDNLSKGKTK